MKKRRTVFALLTIFSFALFLPSFIAKGEDKLSEREIKQKINKLQVPFIANEGQADERVGFYAHVSGGSVFVTKTGEIVYSLTDSTDTKSNQFTQYGYSSQDNPSMAGYIPHDTQCNFNILHHTCYSSYQNCSCYYLKRPDTHSEDESSVKELALKEEIIGGKVAHVKGEGRAVTKVNYFQGGDASQWKSNVSTYEAVNLGEVYEGIELKLKAYGNNVEKLFYVKPNADPGIIEVKLSGAEALSVNEEGQLEVKTELGPVKFTKPVAYQEIDGKRVEVAVEYQIADCKENSKSECVYGFTIASYDKTKDLIIDPMIASTFLGGSDTDANISGLPYGRSLALDTSGNVYVMRETRSLNFPTTSGAYDTSINGADVFISKLDSGLTTLFASTLLSGSANDLGRSLALDTSGNVYVMGYTSPYSSMIFLSREVKMVEMPDFTG